MLQIALAVGHEPLGVFDTKKEVVEKFFDYIEPPLSLGEMEESMFELFKIGSMEFGQDEEIVRIEFWDAERQNPIGFDDGPIEMKRMLLEPVFEDA